MVYLYFVQNDLEKKKNSLSTKFIALGGIKTLFLVCASTIAIKEIEDITIEQHKR